MLGGFRKTVIGGAALGLTALGLAAGPSPVQAGPVEDHVCVVVTQPADVYNHEYGYDGKGHAGQPSNGSWSPKGASIPRYGLYYPVTDPTTAEQNPAAARHAVPRPETFGYPGANTVIPMTAVQTGDHFHFHQKGECKNTANPLSPVGIPFDVKGEAIGYCGRSVGLGVGEVAGRQVVIRWESAASQLVMLDPSALGSVNAQPNAPSSPDGSCSNGTAIRFLVDGVLTDTRP